MYPSGLLRCVVEVFWRFSGTSFCLLTSSQNNLKSLMSVSLNIQKSKNAPREMNRPQRDMEKKNLDEFYIWWWGEEYFSKFHFTRNDPINGHHERFFNTGLRAQIFTFCLLVDFVVICHYSWAMGCNCKVHEHFLKKIFLLLLFSNWLSSMITILFQI